MVPGMTAQPRYDETSLEFQQRLEDQRYRERGVGQLLPPAAGSHAYLEHVLRESLPLGVDLVYRRRKSHEVAPGVLVVTVTEADPSPPPDARYVRSFWWSLSRYWSGS